MSRHDEGFFNAKDKLRLFQESLLPDGEPRAHIGIVHGFADHCGRYRKTTAALVERGFAMHAFDYRGHGQADGRRGHCDAFSDFVDDVEVFWGRVKDAARGKPCFLLGHSHGGLVSLHFLARQPEVTGVILSAPLLQLAFTPSPLQLFAAKALSAVLPWLPQPLPLKPDELSRDPEEQRATEKDPLYNRTLTVRWITEVVKARDWAQTAGQYVRCPALMVCGSADRVVSTPRNRAFFDTIVATDKTYKEYDGFEHEVLNEVGRERVWEDISVWISAHL